MLSSILVCSVPFLIAMMTIMLTNAADINEVWSQIICITDDLNNSNHDNCNVRNSTFNSDIAKMIANNTLILFMKRTLPINECITIKNKKNIAFRSIIVSTVIQCEPIELATGHPGYGLSFLDVSNISIVNVALLNCGSLQRSTSLNTTVSDPPQIFRSALYIVNCTNIEILTVEISQSIGTAMAMFDCNGLVVIDNCIFVNNTVPTAEGDVYSGGNAIYIMFSYCSPMWYGRCDPSSNIHNSHSQYKITDCTFVGNSVTRLIPENGKRSKNWKNSFRGIGKGGGGISIFLKGNAFNNSIELTRINATSNHAGKFCYGGGFYLQFQDTAKCNNITLTNSFFIQNTAYHLGGGGADIGFYFPFDKCRPTKNHILINDTIFHSNSGGHGGGLIFFSSSGGEYDAENTINFEGCQWIGNEAGYGAAAVFGPIDFSNSIINILPSPKFLNCLFIDNKIKPHTDNSSYDDDNDDFKERSSGPGIIYIKIFTVIFQQDLQFINNIGSPLYVLNGCVRVVKNGVISFSDNIANYGGGLALIGLSAIHVGDNVTFSFKNNRVINKGGAIYVYSVDKVASRYFGLCFVQFIYENFDFDPNNVTFVFEGNRAESKRGMSVYVTSLLSCALLCDVNSIADLTPEEIFNCIGNSTFVNGTFLDNVATDATRFIPKQLPDYIIPGKPFLLPADMQDEVGHNLSTSLLRTVLLKRTGQLQITETHTSNFIVNLTGQPNDEGILHVDTETFHNVSFTVNVCLSQCPPGFILENNICKCAVLSNDLYYSGIFACDNKNFRAFINIGYWVGYIPSDDAVPANLVTGTCPLGYCAEFHDRMYVTLPANPSSEELDSLICQEQNRTGILCGKCISDHSVYYHSYRYKCGPNTYCHFGILFYVLSEIIPITIIFTITIIFRVNFTSGYLNGFVLFAQMLDSLSLAGNGAVAILSNSQTIALEIIHLVYSPFNLDMFRIESLSFCLHEGLNFLHIASLRFLTLTYALILVLVLVFTMRCSCCYKLQLVCFKTRLTNSSSLINGLSAFLVLCYAQCCVSCYQILNIAWLRGQGSRFISQPRVFRMGDIDYMGKEHLPYALVSIVFFVGMVVMPTVVLFFHPLCYQLLPESVLNWPKIRWFCIKIELFAPFLDAFQGCFKDKFRYFAGLYFIYRSVANGTFAFINARMEVYIVSEVILLFMLAIHSWAQPYRKQLHNNIDTGIFLIMIIINTLTIYRYYETQTQTYPWLLSLVTDIQLFLVYLPAMGLVIFICAYLVCWKCHKHRQIQRESQYLPELLYHREDLSLSGSYHKKNITYNSTFTMPTIRDNDL